MNLSVFVLLLIVIIPFVLGSSAPFSDPSIHRETPPDKSPQPDLIVLPPTTAITPPQASPPAPKNTLDPSIPLTEEERDEEAKNIQSQLKKIMNTNPPTNFLSAISSIANYFYSGAGVGPTKTNWYEVEQWEIDACRIWGGASRAVRSSTGADEISSITLSQLTASLQAKKTSYPDNTTLYEVSWYIEPITGSVNYKILLINSRGESTVLVPSGSASSSGGSSQYLPIGPILNNATNNFTRIEMRKSDNSLLIRTKIVEDLVMLENVEES